MNPDQTIADLQLQKTLLKLDHHYHQSKVWRARCIYSWIAIGALVIWLIVMASVCAKGEEFPHWSGSIGQLTSTETAIPLTTIIDNSGRGLNAKALQPRAGLDNRQQFANCMTEWCDPNVTIGVRSYGVSAVVVTCYPRPARPCLQFAIYFHSIAPLPQADGQRASGSCTALPILHNIPRAGRCLPDFMTKTNL